MTQHNLHMRLVQSQNDILSAIAKGPSSLETFRKDWANLRADFEKESRLHGVDEELSHLAHSTASIVATLADSFSRLDSASDERRVRLLSTIENIYVREVQERMPDAALRWFLENIHDPYPSDATLTSLSSAISRPVANLTKYFLDLRKQVGWPTLIRTLFGGSRPAAVEAARRAYLHVDPAHPLPVHVQSAFDALKAKAEALLSGKPRSSSQATVVAGKDTNTLPAATHALDVNDEDEDTTPPAPIAGRKRRVDEATEAENASPSVSIDGRVSKRSRLDPSKPSPLKPVLLAKIKSRPKKRSFNSRRPALSVNGHKPRVSSPLASSSSITPPSTSGAIGHKPRNPSPLASSSITPPVTSGVNGHKPRKPSPLASSSITPPAASGVNEPRKPSPSASSSITPPASFGVNGHKPRKSSPLVSSSITPSSAFSANGPKHRKPSPLASSTTPPSSAPVTSLPLIPSSPPLPPPPPISRKRRPPESEHDTLPGHKRPRYLSSPSCPQVAPEPPAYQHTFAVPELFLPSDWSNGQFTSVAAQWPSESMPPSSAFQSFDSFMHYPPVPTQDTIDTNPHSSFQSSSSIPSPPPPPSSAAALDHELQTVYESILEVFGTRPPELSAMDTGSDGSGSGTSSPQTPNNEVYGSGVGWNQGEVFANMGGLDGTGAKGEPPWITGGYPGLDGFDASNLDFDMNTVPQFDLAAFAPPALPFPSDLPFFEQPLASLPDDDIATNALMEMLMMPTQPTSMTPWDPISIDQLQDMQLQEWCSLFTDST